MENKELKLTRMRIQFNKKHDKLTESEVQKELLFLQVLTLDRLEKIKVNTATLVWFLIVIPIIVGVVAAVLLN